jgi:hypothetical protein
LLVQLALLELCARSNDGLALSREFSSLLDDSASGLDTRRCRVDRRQRIGRFGNRADEEVSMPTILSDDSG